MGTTTQVLLVGGLSPGFAVVTAIAGLLLGSACALVVAGLGAADRRGRDGAIALLGASGVAVHVMLALRNPASGLGFLSGTAGASVTVVAASRTLDTRGNDLAAQALGVTGLVWVAGSVTVVGGTVATEWPLALAGAVGAATLGGAVIASRIDPEGYVAAYRRPSIALGTAFLVPSLVGIAFGSEVLFVTFLVGVGILVVCWWLVRAYQATRPGR